MSKEAAESGEPGMKKEMQWMYGDAGKILDRDKYLTGSKIDKNFELYGSDGKKEHFGNIESLISKAAETSSKPKAGSSALDLETVRKEDPLVAIKLQEEKVKRDVLNNPVKMKKLQKMVMGAMEKKMKAALKDEYKQHKKQMKKQKKQERREARKANKRARSSSDDDDDRRQSHSRRGDQRKRDHSGSPQTSRRRLSASAKGRDELARPALKHEREERYKSSQDSQRRRRHDSSDDDDDKASSSRRKASRDHDTSDRPSSRQLQTRTHWSETTGRRDSNSHKEADSTSVAIKRERTSPERPQKKDAAPATSRESGQRMKGPAMPPPGTASSSDSDSGDDHRRPSPTHSDSDEEKKKMAFARSFGLVKMKKDSSDEDDSKSAERKSAGDGKPPSDASSSQLTTSNYYRFYKKAGEVKPGAKPPDEQKSADKRKKQLTKEEKAAKLAEMTGNAHWREQQRDRNLKMFSDLDKAEKDRNEHGKKKQGSDFIRPMLSNATDTGTVEERLKRTKGSLQKGRGDMERSFIKNTAR